MKLRQAVQFVVAVLGVGGAIWLLVAVVAWVGLFALLVLAPLARAQAQHEHGWYPRSCCNTRDCRVIDPGAVYVTQLGYYLPDLGRTVRFDAANSSPDGDYHICIDDWDGSLRKNRNGDPSMNRSPLCFWAPEHGS